QIDGFIQQMNAVTNKLAARGMGFGFHNHARELKPYKDTTFWDHIATSTPDNFILQLDVGWATYAGVDAAAYVRKYPGRTLTTHYKATSMENVTSKQPFIGEDVTDWPAVIRACVEVGGTLWMVLEQEEYPNNMSQLAAVERSKLGLDKILKMVEAE
ncbi:MAG: sugar phosphate isomerase/epimerase, partial [Psychrosphaera sp.]|nr:sugar phosphate isomerase/epimerase [Psychrosphaera sp.]